MPVFTTIGAGATALTGSTFIGGAATVASALGAGAALLESQRKAANKKAPAPVQPTFDPFAVDERSVIGAQRDLRKRLANKSGLSAANVTGGLRSDAPGLRPSLFTFS